MNFTFDPLSYPYASRRSVVYGRRGMVATAIPWPPRRAWKF